MGCERPESAEVSWWAAGEAADAVSGVYWADVWGEGEEGMNVDQIMREAQRQLDEEKYLAAVKAAKEKLRNKRPLWERLFPFVITIARRK